MQKRIEATRSSASLLHKATACILSIMLTVSCSGITYAFADGTAPAATDFTFTAPSDLTYDGSAKEATVEVNPEVEGMGEVTVYYSSDDGESWDSAAPINAGTYTVGITVEEGDNYAATDEGEYLTDDDWTFTIAKATPTADAFTFTAPSDTAYDESAKEATVTAADEIIGMGEVTVCYSSDDGATWDTTAPTEVGTYKVGITVAEGDNYAATDEGEYLTSDDWTFTISKWPRLAGEDRYATMVEVVEAAFDDNSAEYVVIASGQNFADSLTASSLAGVLDAPIILVSANELSAEAKAQIERLGAKYAYIVGGESSVSESVLEAVEAIEGMENVERISGNDRYETAVEVAEATVSVLEEKGETIDTVILASGTGYADALSISPYAYVTATPIILVGSDGLLGDAALEWIDGLSDVDSLIIAGGTSSVSSAAVSQTGIGVSTRLAGSDRYATSVVIAKWAIKNGYLSVDDAVVASGQNPFDALAASALCGQEGSVLLLVSDALSTELASFLTDNASSITHGYIVGGTNSVSEAVAAALAEAITVSSDAEPEAGNE